MREVQPYNLHLSGDMVGMNSAVQTPDGFLWIGSTKGLIISDGHTSVMYSRDNPMFPLALDDGGAFLGDLHIDSLGNVYASVSTGAKIIRFNMASRTIAEEWNFEEQSKAAYIQFDISPQGDVYILLVEKSTENFSIWKLNAQGQHFLVFQGTKAAYGTCLNYQRLQSMHWIQTTTGIVRIANDGAPTSFHTFSTALPSNGYRPFKGDHYYFYDPSIHALMYWDSSLVTPKRYTTVPEEVQVNSGYFMVHHEMLYMANGYYFFVLDTLHHTMQDLSAATYEMKKEFYPGAISEDILGFRMIDHKVFLLGSKFLYELKARPPSKQKFQELIPFSRPDVSMRGLAEDEHQNVYASFYNGVVVKPKGESQFKSWSPLTNFNSDQYSAYSLTYKTPYLFWHSLKINTQSGIVSPSIPNYVNGHVVQLLSGDTVWMYTWYGHNLYTYAIQHGSLDSIHIQSSSEKDGDFPNIINKIINSRDLGAMWMATGSEGIKLVSKQGKILESFSIEQLGTGRQDAINDILLDGTYLWYGCNEGLGKLNTKTREYTMYKDPVIAPGMQQRRRTVFTILPDEHKGYYIGSYQGLVYFDTTTLQYSHLHGQHPLSKPEFNRTSAFKDSQGRYYFGSTNGLYSFLPEELEFQPSADTVYPIKLYGVAIFNGEEKRYRYLTSAMSELDELVLLPSETNIEFSLSVPSFTHNVYYSYRIKGVFDQWSDYAADPKIVVYALPPGRYVLEVKASTNASDSLTSTFELPIFMSAYWYQKAWVWILLTLGLSAVMTFWIRYWYQQKWKRQKALEALRIKISSDLHDDVGSILSGLAMQSQVMSYEMEESKRKPMLELSDMSREAMERMRDTVWAIDARKDKYENLIDRMRVFAEKNLERRNITHTFTFQGLVGKKFISPEVRQNIYLIFKEAITNIVRHSDAQHVHITFSQEGDHINLVIHDNGANNGSGSQAGQGISNMKMRAGRIGGKLQITTEDGFKVVLIV
jgi:signal transduction histidine kinase/streptogramin lyase